MLSQSFCPAFLDNIQAKHFVANRPKAIKENAIRVQACAAQLQLRPMIAPNPALDPMTPCMNRNARPSKSSREPVLYTSSNRPAGSSSSSSPKLATEDSSSSSSLSAPASSAASLEAYFWTYSVTVSGYASPKNPFPRTFNFYIVALGFPNKKRSCFAVERVGRVGISQELGKEHLKDVDHIEHG